MAKFSARFYLGKSITTLLLYMAMSCPNVFAQLPDSLAITGDYRGMPFITFIHDVEQKLPVKFRYHPDWVVNISVNRMFSNVPLTEALERILRETPYMFEAVQGNIILLPREDVAIVTGKMEMIAEGDFLHPRIIGNVNDAGKYRKANLSGHIYSGKDGSPLVGANVIVKSTRYGTITDKDGFFKLEIPTGLFNLLITSVGYEETNMPVKLIAPGKLDIELPEKAINIEEVIISGKKANRNVSANRMSVVELDRKQIKQLPSVFGSKDVLKSVTMIPGVKSVGEFGSDINVRGGGGDQNLYLIEGSPVFNSAHIMGLMSVINPDAVNNVTLYKGDIPAKYGERVSSVMDIELKKDIATGFHGYGGLGVIDSRLTFEMPIIKNKLSVTAGGRTTYSNWLLKRLPDINLRESRANFYDFHGMINFNPNAKNKINILYYASHDLFKYASELKYTYSNQLASLRWQHTYGEKLYSVFSLHGSQYDITKHDIFDQYSTSQKKAGLIYASAKFGFTYTGLKKQTLEWGIQSNFYKISPGKLTPSDSLSMVIPAKLKDEQAIESAVYFTDKIDFNEKVSLNLGLRISAYSFLGPYTQNKYLSGKTRTPYTISDSSVYTNGEMVKTYLGFEPRISLKFQIDEASSLKMNYNRNFQYISMVSYTSVFTPDDRWKLADPFTKPLRADQFALGYFRNFRQNTIETSVEVYYKKLKNLIEYKNGAIISMNPLPETILIDADGRNYGLELMVKKNYGRWDGWISYTYARSMKQTTGSFKDEKINKNSWYPSNYDKPHDLTVFTTYRYNKRLRVTFNFNLSSGRSVTLPELKYYVDGEWAIYYSDRNKYRLPAYHRLDLAVSYDESIRLKKKWKGSWTFSIMNVYGRHNAYSVFFRKDDPIAGNDSKQFSLYKLYIIGQPIPFLTYNFIF
jgi:hypothetical protein